MSLVAILTPSYKRSNMLKILYESLCRQTSNNFKWYIVNDGSMDDTAEIVSSFENDNFEIIYLEKENGGKHTAINYALPYINEELVFIVDNDDYLADDAIEVIEKDWKIYNNRADIGGLSYYKLKPDSTLVGKGYESTEPIIDYFINMRVNKRISGDKAEVWRTDVLKAHPFPVFDGEKFLSEAVVWNAISRDGYKMVFISKGIYYCEYLIGGLSASGRKYRLQNPLGTMEHALAHICKEVKTKIRMKYMLLYIATVFFSSVTLRSAFKKLRRYKLLFVLEFIPAWLLAIYWKRKYSL